MNKYKLPTCIKSCFKWAAWCGGMWVLFKKKPRYENQYWHGDHWHLSRGGPDSIFHIKPHKCSKKSLHYRIECGEWFEVGAKS